MKKNELKNINSLKLFVELRIIKKKLMYSTIYYYYGMHLAWAEEIVQHLLAAADVLA